MENKNQLSTTNSLKAQPTYVSIVEQYNSTVKVRDVKPDNRHFWSRTRITLAQCSLMLGSKTAPSDEEYFILKNVLIENFKDFSPEEILTAFNKLVAGRLNVEPDKYGKISAAYLGQVLIAFRQERHKALAEELRNKPKEPTKEPDMDEKQRIRRDYVSQCIIKPYIALKHGVNKFSRIDTNNLFKFLYKTKLIEPSKEELNDYKEKALGEMLDNAHKYSSGVKEKNLLKIEIIKIKNGNESKELGRVKQEAAHIYVIDWLKALSNSDGDLSEILKDSGFYEVQE